ncbi:MAG TPA: hypothetical protein VFY65_03375, partial [Longimicrobium sp.]|nr:hypothetical protein [Longimicrobium sp.]
MKSSFAFRATLALAATLFAAACDGSPSAPTAAVDAEVAFTTGAPLPAVPGFAAQANPVFYTGPRALLTWQDVEGEDVYLIQWRVGDAGAWKTLVTTGPNRTHFETDSAREGQRNYYRIAAMTPAFQAGPFTTMQLRPGVLTGGASLLADSLARISIDYRNYAPSGTYAVQYGTDPELDGAQQTPGAVFTDAQNRRLINIPVVAGNRYYYRVVGT